MRRVKFIAAPFLLLSACVSPGYEGQVGSVVSGDQIIAQREANRSIAVFATEPAGYQGMGEISVRRCHRSAVEEPPSIAVLTDDLQIAAYGQGADAISDIRTEKLNGLAANCWYVVEATALMLRR